jgi:hypothetical protein
MFTSCRVKRFFKPLPLSLLANSRIFEISEITHTPMNHSHAHAIIDGL